MLVHCRRFVAAIIVSAIAAGPVIAQDRPQNYHRALSAACSTEIHHYCKNVPDTHGQLVACLYGSQAHLSPRCEGTVWTAMERLGKALGKKENVMQACDIDARMYCKETISGSGNLLSCF